MELMLLQSSFFARSVQKNGGNRKGCPHFCMGISLVSDLAEELYAHQAYLLLGVVATKLLDSLVE